MCVFVNNKKPSCWWVEFNTIQSHRYSMWLTPTLTPVFFSRLSLSRLLFLFFSTDGSTIEKRNFFSFLSLSSLHSFPMKYKHWIRIISPFNSSTWFTVCYSKGVSLYCSLSLSRSLLIAAVGSGIFKPTTAFVRSFVSLPFGRTRKKEKERKKEYFLSLSFPYSANTLPSDVTVISIGA